MLTGISKDILDAYLAGRPTPGITKGLLNRLVRVHEARLREEWAAHHKIYLPDTGLSVWNREQDIMKDIERYIIKKLRM